MEEIKKIYFPSALTILAIYLHLYFTADIVSSYLGDFFSLAIMPIIFFGLILTVINKVTSDHWKILKKEKFKVAIMVVMIYLPIMHLFLAIIFSGEV